MASDELAEILDDLRRGYDGDAWHGSPLIAILDGVTAQVASAHPIPGAHSIWEFVVHLDAWCDVAIRRIEEGRPIEEPDDGPFPSIGVDLGEPAWRSTLDHLAATHERVLQAVSHLDPSRLRDPVAGKGYDVGHMLRGLAQHMSYHAGQIAMLKKASARGMEG